MDDVKAAGGALENLFLGRLKVVKNINKTVKITKRLDKAKQPLQLPKPKQSTGNATKGMSNVNLTRAHKRNLDTLDNIINKHLTDKDFSGSLRDLQDNPVPKPGGGYWNHLQEMKDSYKGLIRIRKGLEGSLKNPNLNDATRKVLQEGLDKANKNIKKIENLFEPFGGIN